MPVRIRQRRPRQDRRPRPGSNNAAWNAVQITSFLADGVAAQVEVQFNMPCSAPSEANPSIDFESELRATISRTADGDVSAGTTQLQFTGGTALMPGDFIRNETTQEIAEVLSDTGGGKYECIRGAAGTTAQAGGSGQVWTTCPGSFALVLFAQTQPQTITFDVDGGELTAGMVVYPIDTTGIYFNGPELERFKRVTVAAA